MNFTVNNVEHLQTNSAIHSVNTQTMNQLHRPIANLCFQKSAYYSGIKIFNSLSSSLTSLKGTIQSSIKKYLITHSFYSVDEFLIFTNNS
jgi:hypothetical protein